jgi:hypothetical protein
MNDKEISRMIAYNELGNKMLGVVNFYAVLIISLMLVAIIAYHFNGISKETAVILLSFVGGMCGPTIAVSGIIGLGANKNAE